MRPCPVVVMFLMDQIEFSYFCRRLLMDQIHFLAIFVGHSMIISTILF